MEPGPNGLTPSPRFFQACQDMFPEVDAKYVAYTPPMDSSHIDVKDWNHLIHDIHRHRDDVDGVMILHGTDTMAYTAAVLSSVLCGYGKPIILTGAQKPWGMPDSDARINMHTAYWALHANVYAGVGVAFHRRIWRGSTVRKTDAEGFDAFMAPNDLPLADVGLHPLWFEERIQDEERYDHPATYLPPVSLQSLRLPVFFLVPGLANLDWLAKCCLENPPDGLIVLAFGNGNLPEHRGMLRCVKHMTENGKPVWLLTQVQRGRVDDIYAANLIWRRSGAIFKGDLTPEYAYAQMLLQLTKSQTKAEPSG